MGFGHHFTETEFETLLMKDIETREDIDLLMVKFYGRAFNDDLLGYVFTDVAKIDLKKIKVSKRGVCETPFIGCHLQIG